MSKEYLVHEDLSGQPISAAELEYREATSEEKRRGEVAKDTIIGLAGSLALSRILKDAMLGVSSVNIAKSAGVKYGDAVRNFRITHPGYRDFHSKRMLSYRTVNALVPATLTQIISNNLSLSPDTSAVIHASFASIMISIFGRSDAEGAARFHAVNAYKFCFVDENGKGINLLELNNEQKFNKYCNYFYGDDEDKKKERKFRGNEIEWCNLTKRQETFRENRPYRDAVLFLRNFTYAAVLFGGGASFSQELAKDYGQVIQDVLGVSKEKAELLFNSVVYGGLAAATTIFDTPLTQLSTGKEKGPEVIKQFFENLATLNLKRSMSGAVARTVFMGFSTATILAGPMAGNAIIGASESIAKSVIESCELTKPEFNKILSKVLKAEKGGAKDPVAPSAPPSAAVRKANVDGAKSNSDRPHGL